MSGTIDTFAHEWGVHSDGHQVVNRCLKCGISALDNNSGWACSSPPVPSAPLETDADAAPPDYISNLMRKAKAAGQESKAASLKYDMLLRAVIVALKAHGLAWIVRPDILEDLKNDQHN